MRGRISSRASSELVTIKPQLQRGAINISPTKKDCPKGSDPISYTNNRPNATKHTAHHMLIYGCEEPGSDDGYWSCGEMHTEDADHSPPCQSKSQIIYAWAMDAPELKLPEGVGFRVGLGSDIKYLVLQVRYHITSIQNITTCFNVYRPCMHVTKIQYISY